MSRIPFTVYDFFAYLSSGGLVVAAFDVVFGNQWVLRDEIGFGRGLVLILAAYVAGHLIAHFSSFLLEQVGIGRVLERPSSILLGASGPRGLKNLFPGYYRPLPKETQDRITKAAAARSAPTSGEGLFLHAYGLVTRDKATQERLDEFRNLYGFARNMTLALLVITLPLAVGTWTKQLPESYAWSALSAVLGIGMFYRYLKFFRQFSYQVFITYAEREVRPEAEKR